MPAFKFRLATLVKLREATRDERRAQLAQAYQAEEIVRREVERLDAEAADLAAWGRKACQPGEVNADRLMELRRYQAVLHVARQEVERQHRIVRDEVERRREALAEANRQVRILEQLRERQLTRHREDEERRSVKELDEVAVRRTAREAL